MGTGRRAGARVVSPLLAALAVLLAIVIVAPLGPGSPPQAVATEPVARCADLVVLGARASGQRLTDANLQMGTEVHAMATAAVARLDPAVSVRLAGLPYAAVPTSRGTAAYEASVRDGVDRLAGRLAGLLGACPGTRVALAGFSQGADVVHRTVAGLSLPAAQLRRVVAVALIADPTYDARSANAHQVRYGVDEPRRSGLLGPGPALPPLLAARTVDLCHADDLVCSFGGPDGEIWMASWAGRPHSAFYEQPGTIAVNGRAFAEVIRAGLE